MGVRFNRSYPDILRELSEAVACIPDPYLGFEMTSEQWDALDDRERSACLRTLSDDIFYGLGHNPVLRIGSGKIAYDRDRHLIKVIADSRLVHMIHLV